MGKKWVKWCFFGGLLLVLLAGFCRFALAGPRVYVGRPCGDVPLPSFAEVDHASFDALLKKYVSDQGLVAYRPWKNNAQDLQTLDDYLVRLGCVDLAKATSKEAKLAFWINAYNAVTLKGILREYPTSSIRNHTAKVVGYNIWKDLHLWVSGKSYSLDDIEHAILRKLGEPRIHFAVVCASKGCPALVNRAFTEKNLEELLVFNARRFFAQPANFRIDSSRRSVYISQLLQWYGSDFASSATEQLRILRSYLPDTQPLDVLQGSYSVGYLPYDWGLNDQQPTPR